MHWTAYNIISVLVILVLLALVPVLRIGFGASWFWATSPVWGAILLIVALVVGSLIYLTAINFTVD